MLDLPSRWEAQDVLSRHHVWPGTTREDFEEGLHHLGVVLDSRPGLWTTGDEP